MFLIYGVCMRICILDTKLANPPPYMCRPIARPTFALFARHGDLEHEHTTFAKQNKKDKIQLISSLPVQYTLYHLTITY